MLNAANYVEFNILIKVCIKTIAQKFDSSSLENTVSNLKLDRKEILNHESIVQNNVITYEAVFRQLETQYRVASDMMIQIYKSIPLSSLVRLNAPVKIIGALFIAFTSNEAYMTNDEIEIYLNHKDAESIGYSLLKAFKDNTTISHLLPDLGYKLDDNGNKHLLTVEDEDEKSLLKAATHPYIFEFIWSIYLRDPREYFAIYCKFNRKDIIEIIYESTKGLEDARLKRKVSDTFTDELYLAFNHGHVLSTKYLVETVGAAFDNQYYKWNNYKYAFRIKEMEKRLRFLNFLYRSKVICSSEIFDAEAKKGNYENVVWLVEHEYSGTFHHIEFELKKMGTLDEQKQKVLDYLRANQLMKWNHGGAFSCGNYNGPTPRTF